MMARHARLLGVTLLLGCASPGTESATAQRAALPAWKRSCQDYAKGPVTIEYQDAPGGAAVLYRARGSELGLRERAREVARFHNGSAAKSGTLHDLSSIPHRAYVEEIADGVKLVLQAKTPRTDDLDRLRWNVQQEVSIKQKSGCQGGIEAL